MSDYCNSDLMHSVLCELKMDINMFWSWDYRNKMDITNRDCENEQC